jgi:hypothetical protein
MAPANLVAAAVPGKENRFELKLLVIMAIMNNIVKAVFKVCS